MEPTRDERYLVYKASCAPNHEPQHPNANEANKTKTPVTQPADPNTNRTVLGIKAVGIQTMETDRPINTQNP